MNTKDIIFVVVLKLHNLRPAAYHYASCDYSVRGKVGYPQHQAATQEHPLLCTLDSLYTSVISRSVILVGRGTLAGITSVNYPTLVIPRPYLYRLLEVCLGPAQSC